MMPKNPILICERCNSEIGRIISDKICVPIRGDMFMEKKPKFGTPFRHYWGFRDMLCPCCHQRPFYYRNAFTVSVDGAKSLQGYIIEDDGQGGIEPVMAPIEGIDGKLVCEAEGTECCGSDECNCEAVGKSGETEQDVSVVYDCPYCDFIGKTEAGLKRHITMMHKND